MHLHLQGDWIPQALFETIASITDHARLRCDGVIHDEARGQVRIPIVRYPLLKQRKTLGNLHDKSHPIAATVTVRNVTACEITDRTVDDLKGEVQLLFGLRLSEGELYVCSAEEDRGQLCYSLTVRMAGLDIEITDDSG